ncbi:MAG: InlB B-repeat-containing protein, partial [Clostridia bacterium]|nr:InlB B-repeat-containing protein [Clostridia bacterium]
MNFKKKMVGLMLMAALAVVPLASCGTTGDNGSGDGSSIVGGVTVPFEETGAYYCATPDGEGALTIDENDFAWAVGSETLNGTYAYDGETLTFTFADGATATATVDGTTLTFKRGNETYIFYKNVKFIVTFKAGTTSTTAEVVNGKAVAAPADPEADDAWFVGWYTSADKLYDFSTPVMGDMTLTARFVDKVEQQEFKVTLYKDGAEYSVLETRGGKLYENELPVLEEAGKTFLGWWVGYEEGAKLSYKYNEHKLGQDTALYAVWASVNPTVSVTATGAAWTNAGSGTYNVTVKNEKGEEVASTTTPKTEYKFNFADKAAGVYSVEVSDVANASLVGVAYYRNKMLDKVNYFEVKEEVTAEGISRVLVFNPIENATKYLITAVCGDSEHSHVKVESTTPVFDFSACQMKEGGITFEVEAVADGYVSSVSAVYAYEADLAEITDLAVNDETEVASWTAVANAEYYVVEIIDDGVSLGVKNVTGTQVSLRGLAGELQVKVYPYARAFNSSVIKTVSYTNNRLATPTNLALNGTSLVWDAVAGAEKYVVKIGDNEYEALTNTLDLTSDDYFENCGMEVAISVKAVSANAGEASRYSDVFTVRLDNTMDASTLSYSAGSISWGAVLGAESYGVR